MLSTVSPARKTCGYLLISDRPSDRRSHPCRYFLYSRTLRRVREVPPALPAGFLLGTASSGIPHVACARDRPLEPDPLSPHQTDRAASLQTPPPAYNHSRIRKKMRLRLCKSQSR